jgi:hypothetical protein
LDRIALPIKPPADVEPNGRARLAYGSNWEAIWKAAGKHPGRNSVFGLEEILVDKVVWEDNPITLGSQLEAW